MRIRRFFCFYRSRYCGENGAYGRRLDADWVFPTTSTAASCTLDVVLVTFDDGRKRAGGYDYHLHDRPHGPMTGTYPDPDLQLHAARL